MKTGVFIMLTGRHLDRTVPEATFWTFPFKKKPEC